MCDEKHLEEALAQYKTQFLQVQSMLEELGEEQQTDLVNIRNDLMELIQVTEESLLSFKKSKLLQLVEEHSSLSDSLQVPSCSEGVDDTNGEEYDIIDDNEDDDENNIDIEDNSVTGMKCRVPYTHEWGVTEQHNAMVLDVEDSEENENHQNTKVRVLFTHPTHVSMLCCPYFLDGKCRFSEKDCRYSHGYVVNLDDLLPFKEPDFRHLKVGHYCLARYEDGLWYKATIKCVDDLSVTVHYETYHLDGTLEIESILPQDISDESPDDSDLDEDSSSDFNDDMEDKVVAEFVNQPNSKNCTSPDYVLGEWEVHTKGIGSKLMAKMGYISGQGLGKESDGRVEPVEVVLLPAGKSLDKCAELREKNHLIEPFKKKKPKLNKGKTEISNHSSGQTKGHSDVFEFINNKLLGKRGKVSEIPTSIKSLNNGATASARLKTMKRNDANTNWNLQLFKVQEQIAVIEKSLHKENQTLSRHVGRDSAMTQHITGKITSIESQLKHLREQEESIKKKIHHKTQHKKLTEF